MGQGAAATTSSQSKAKVGQNNKYCIDGAKVNLQIVL